MKKSLGEGVFVGATIVWVVGTYDKEGKPNLMTAAWGGVCCSDPPCIGVSLRKATYSYSSIVERKAFTVSIPPAGYAKETDYAGIASGREIDKWQATGLTPERSKLVDAPHVAEFPLIIECRLVHTMSRAAHALHRRDSRRKGGPFSARRGRRNQHTKRSTRSSTYPASAPTIV